MFEEYKKRKTKMLENQKKLQDINDKKNEILKKENELLLPINEIVADNYYYQYKDDDDVKNIVDLSLKGNGFYSIDKLIDSMISFSENGIKNHKMFIQYNDKGILISYNGHGTGANYKDCGVDNIYEREKQRAVAMVLVDSIKSVINEMCMSKGYTDLRIEHRFCLVYRYQPYLEDRVCVGEVDSTFLTYRREEQEKLDRVNMVKARDSFPSFRFPFNPNIEDGAVVSIIGLQKKKLRQL